MKRWDPSVPCSEREERLLKLAAKSRKLLVFLRERRHEIFDLRRMAVIQNLETVARREQLARVA